jgi:hypothetical protein
MTSIPCPLADKLHDPHADPHAPTLPRGRGTGNKRASNQQQPTDSIDAAAVHRLSPDLALPLWTWIGPAVGDLPKNREGEDGAGLSRVAALCLRLTPGGGHNNIPG